MTPETHGQHQPRQDDIRYRALVEGSIQGILIHRAWAPLFVNQAFAATFGYPSPEAILQMPSVAPLFAPHSHPWLIRDQMPHSQSTPAPVYFEAQGTHRDGSTLWLENLVTDVTWEGRPAIQMTMIDITEQKRAQAECQRLEHQLRQVQQIETLGAFAGGIAHDFNNLLSIILLQLDLALMNLSPQDVSRHDLNIAQTAGTRAKELIRQLTSFCQQHTADRRPVHLTALIEEVCTLIQPSLPATISLNTVIEDASAYVLADATQLHRVLMNLCTNALHAMRGARGIIEFRLEKVEHTPDDPTRPPELEPGVYARLTVQDTGHGIEPHIRDHIFDLFFTTKDRGEGTGLGLTLSQRIITSHHGVVTVESIPGKGTTFAIYLPRLTEPLLSTTNKEISIPGGHERLLFITQEESLARLEQAILQRLGYEVAIGTNSREAISALRDAPHQFDLILIDYNMPQMSERAFAQQAREVKPNIGLILCAPFSSVISTDQLEVLGIDAMCRKPLVMQELGPMIRRVLTSRPDS